MTLSYYYSTVPDGSMKSPHNDQIVAYENRVKFLNKHHIKPENTTLHTLSYADNNYCRYRTLKESTKSDGILRDSTINADAVVVTEPNHAVLLPLADCIGAVIYDPIENILMVSHLGRHNLEQFGGKKCIEYLVNKCGLAPSMPAVYLGPAAGGKNYPLHAFDNLSMHDVAIKQLTAAGISPANITASPIDTTTHPDYFSHSEFLKKHQPLDGRFALVAIMN